MLSPFELSLIIVLIAGAMWWWRIHGLREFALRCIKTHCQTLNLTLLDGYVALKKLCFQRDSYGKLRFTRVYSFEFTVTGETRYTGYISLWGYHIGSIELPPYPFELQQAPYENNLETKQTSPMITLININKGKNNHDKN